MTDKRATGGIGINIKFTEEDFAKSPEELLGEERINEYKKQGDIVEFTKMKKYRCEQWTNKCNCGYDDIEQDDEFQYCPKCGEQLLYEHEYPEKTPYSGIQTAKSSEEAIEKFLDDDYIDEAVYDEVKCYERISVIAWYKKQGKLGDGYKPNK